jgi:hypothetical protein
MKVKHFLAQGCTVAMNVTDNTLQIGLSNKSNQEPNFSRKKGFLIATGRAVNKPINVNLNIENFQLTGKVFHNLANRIQGFRNPISSYNGSKNPSREQSRDWKSTLNDFKNITELISEEEYLNIVKESSVTV